jgi:serine-type D-Ala-D-Ala carboxypeptidase/endopeptidase
MQLPQVLIPAGQGYSLPGGSLNGPMAYGFGLFIDEDPSLGRVVSHSGGYPGFGSNMRWHSATGVGVIALGNGTYARMSMLAAMILQAIVPHAGPYAVALAPAATSARSADEAAAGGPWPETLAAREAVTALLGSVAAAVSASDASAAEDRFAAASAAGLLTENVALDRPYRERVHDVALLHERIGSFADSGRPAEHDTPAGCRWFLTGESGTSGKGVVIQAQLQLTPEKPPRVQSLTLATPPAAGSPLALTLAAVIAWMNGFASSWPVTIPLESGTDPGLLARRLRMASAWTGRVTPGAYRAGDGTSTVTVELSGEHAPAVLALSLDPATGALRAADVTL